MLAEDQGATMSGNLEKKCDRPGNYRIFVPPHNRTMKIVKRKWVDGNEIPSDISTHSLVKYYLLQG